MHPDDRDKVKDAFVRSLERRETGMLEHRLMTPHGRIKFVIERWEIFVGEGDGEPRRAIGTCQDITERLVLEEQLRQSQKMEAVGQLTGGVAHDFNNILTLILANVDAMLEDAKLAPEISRRLERISGAVQRAGDLTHQLLAFSRKQTLQPQHTDFNMLVTSTEKLLRRTLGERVEIATALATDLWATSIDRAQLEAALVNLCLNARDAMPGGGRLLIETGNVVFDEGHVARHSEASLGDHVMLSVTDGGVGMTPEVRRRVFEPFFTTKPEGEGTGLGLSMVYGFIKQSGGHIEIGSEIGRGTTVRLYLPRSQAPAVANAVKEDSSLPRGSERILVIEDEAFVRMAVVDQLGDLGYAVTEAANGMAGLALLKAGETYDLLLTDVVMPGAVDGKGLADEAVRLQPGLRVLFMSGYPAGVTSPRGILDPDVTLLNKPFRMTELARAVRDMIDR